jgi:hypothetical protein
MSSMLVRDRYRFDKKHVGTRYAKLVFLHPVGVVRIRQKSASGQVVHSGVSRARKVDALFFMLRWELYGFHKMSSGTRYAKLVFFHSVGSLGHVVHSGASGA